VRAGGVQTFGNSAGSSEQKKGDLRQDVFDRIPTSAEKEKYSHLRKGKREEALTPGGRVD